MNGRARLVPVVPALLLAAGEASASDLQDAIWRA
jgi:hypothetical protein